jgi:hypothetical protein
VLLVHREGEDARVRFEDERRAVAVMHVEIDDRRALDAARPQHTNRNGDVVERTEAFAVVSKRVMEPAAYVTHDGARGPGLGARILNLGSRASNPEPRKGSRSSSRL